MHNVEFWIAIKSRHTLARDRGKKVGQAEEGGRIGDPPAILESELNLSLQVLLLQAVLLPLWIESALCARNRTDLDVDRVFLIVIYRGRQIGWETPVIKVPVFLLYRIVSALVSGRQRHLCPGHKGHLLKLIIQSDRGRFVPFFHPDGKIDVGERSAKIADYVRGRVGIDLRPAALDAPEFLHLHIDDYTE